MASVNFTGSKDTGRGGKLKGAGEVKAQMRHCDKYERLEHEHANKNINKSLTEYNYTITGKSFHGATRSYERRLNEIDTAVDADGNLINRNHRKDRVTCFCLEVPCPDAVPAEDRPDWFRSVADIMRTQYGRNNFIEGYIHVDEIHEYYDSDKKQLATSLEHMHAFIIPEHEGRLNGKWFSSIANINSLNTAIDDMTQRDYGCRFLTGEKKKGKSVERLKKQSTDALKQAAAETNTLNSELSAQIAALQREREEYAEQVEKALEKADTAYKECVKVIQGANAVQDAYMSFLGCMHPKRKDGTPMDMRQEFVKYAEKKGLQFNIPSIGNAYTSRQDAQKRARQVQQRRVPDMPVQQPDGTREWQLE